MHEESIINSMVLKLINMFALFAFKASLHGDCYND